MVRLLPLLSLLIAACTPDTRFPHALVTDSAGTRIVANGSLRDSVTRIGAEPVMRVGWGDGELQFANLTAGALLEDGSVVVFDEGPRILYKLSPEGAAVARVGGSGEGPGEFRSGDAIEVLPGDTVVVFDPAQARLSLFDGDGVFLASGRWTSPIPVVPRPAGVSASGRLLWAPSEFIPMRGDEPGRRWVEGPLMTSSPLGQSPDTVAMAPLFELLREPGGRPVLDPFMRMGSVDGYLGGFVQARSDRPELRWLDESGALWQIARWDAEPVPVDDAVWARYGEAYRTRMGSMPSGPSEERIAQVLEERRRIASSTLPYFSRVSVEPDGDVWLEEWTPLGVPGRVFHVFAADGAFIRRVEFTRPFRLLALGRGLVLGVETDELDVQAVAVYVIPG